MCFPYFPLDLHSTISRSYPLPSLPLIIYYMTVTILEANQKYTEEEVPSFILERPTSGRRWRWHRVWKNGGSLLGWEGERQCKWREDCPMAERHKVSWLVLSHAGSRSGVARSQGCVEGLRVGGKDKGGRMVKNRLLHSRAQNIQTCGQWAIFTPTSPEACWFPTVGPCYVAPPTAPFYKPVLSFQEKRKAVFLTNCTPDLPSTPGEGDFIVKQRNVHECMWRPTFLEFISYPWSQLSPFFREF